MPGSICLVKPANFPIIVNMAMLNTGTSTAVEVLSGSGRMKIMKVSVRGGDRDAHLLELVFTGVAPEGQEAR